MPEEQRPNYGSRVYRHFTTNGPIDTELRPNIRGSGFEERVRDRAITESTVLLNKLKTTNPAITESVEAAKSLLNTLQSDALGELGYAWQIRVADPSREHHLDKIQVLDIGDTKAGTVVFLLLSNLFNRSDELIETAVESSGKPERAQSVFQGVYEHGAAAIIHEPDGIIKRVSPKEMIAHIQTIADATGITTNLHNEIDPIFTAHALGLGLVKGNNYTIDEAVDYRIATSGVYYHLLATTLFEDDTNRQLFSALAMDAQYYDDLGDVNEDLDVQVNPFIPIRQEPHVLVRKEQRQQVGDAYVECDLTRATRFISEHSSGHTQQKG